MIRTGSGTFYRAYTFPSRLCAKGFFLKNGFTDNLRDLKGIYLSWEILNFPWKSRRLQTTIHDNPGVFNQTKL